MPITVKHSPSAAALGESAYTIGRGEKKRWATDVALKQQALGLQAASIGASARARAAALEQREKESERLHGLREEELGFRKQQWEDEPARQLERGLQQQKILQSKVSWQYDEGQKREMAKVTTGVAWLRDQVSAGKWTAEQAEQAEQQLWRKYHSIIPLPVYDDTATPQERYESGTVTDQTTGAKYRENERGGFDLVGASYKESADFYINVAKLFTTEDEISGKKKVDWEGVDEFVGKAEGRIAQRQGLSARAEEIQAKQQQIADEKQQEEQQQERQVEMQAAVEALPVMFDAIIKGKPKIGRKIKDQTSIDKVYGEEAYNKVLVEAIGRGEQEGIPPEEVKAELDKWWDAEHDKERGQRFQKFANRMEFKGASGTERVKMKAPNGEIYEVDQAEVKEAEEHGWQIL